MYTRTKPGTGVRTWHTTRYTACRLIHSEDTPHSLSVTFQDTEITVNTKKDALLCTLVTGISTSTVKNFRETSSIFLIKIKLSTKSSEAYYLSPRSLQQHYKPSLHIFLSTTQSTVTWKCIIILYLTICSCVQHIAKENPISLVSTSCSRFIFHISHFSIYPLCSSHTDFHFFENL